MLIFLFNFLTINDVMSRDFISDEGISNESYSFDTVAVTGEFMNNLLNYSPNYFGVRVYNASQRPSNEEVGLIVVGIDHHMKDIYSEGSMGYFYCKPGMSESPISINHETALTYMSYVQQDIRIPSFNSVFTKSGIESAWGENIPNLMYLTPNEFLVNEENYPNAQMLFPISNERGASNNEIIGEPCPPMCPR